MPARPGAPSKSYVHQENCDLTKPEEHFLWMLMAIPVGNEMMPILENSARTISKHLYECGARFHPKLQEKKYQAPPRGQQNHMNGAARWVGMDAPEPEPLVLPDVGAMNHEEQQWLIAELKRHGALHEEKPELKSVAAVADWDRNQERRIKRVTSAAERGLSTPK